MKKMNPVIHFEMPSEDKERMKKFYAETFGWEYIQLGSDMGDYTVVMTTESDENGPLKKGIINGGFYKKSADPYQYPSVVIAVDNVEEHLKKVEDAGGEVLSQPDNIPGVGLFASIRDTEGNRISLLQPVDDMGKKE